MRRALLCTLVTLFLMFATQNVLAQKSEVIVLSEPAFPAADSAAPSAEQLSRLFPSDSRFSVEQLGTALASSSARLLVLPYGSAFPEDNWSAQGWHLRDYSVRFIRPLMIDQYQETPGSEGLQFQSNRELSLRLEAFSWKRAFSPVIRLSRVDLYPRGGAAGSLDARLDTLAWGVKDGRKLSAPAIQVDHDRNGFDGGRWIFVNAELGREIFDNKEFIQSLVIGEAYHLP